MKTFSTLILGGVLAGLPTLYFAHDDSSIREVVRTQKLVIVDSSGRDRLIIETEPLPLSSVKDQALQINAFGPSGKACGSLVLSEDGSLMWLGGRGKASATISALEGAEVHLKGMDGNQLLQRVFPKGDLHITSTDSAGITRKKIEF